MSPYSAPGRLLFSRPGVNLAGLLRDHVWGPWNFSNKGLSADGLRFTLIFTGVNSNDAWNTVKGHFVLKPAQGGTASFSDGDIRTPGTLSGYWEEIAGRLATRESGMRWRQGSAPATVAGT